MVYCNGKVDTLNVTLTPTKTELKLIENSLTIWKVSWIAYKYKMLLKLPLMLEFYFSLKIWTF